MLGRGGAWVGLATAKASLGRFWFYQDFPAGSGPALTITQNNNGTIGGAPFDAGHIVDASAVITRTNGNAIYSNPQERPTDLVKVGSHTGTAVALTATPDVNQGTERVWYLYAADQRDLPTDIVEAPQFVTETRSEQYDLRYLNQSLNLSDLPDANASRTNLGFPVDPTGAILFGNGTNVPTFDVNTFNWDNVNKRLGIGINTQEQPLHVFSNTAPNILVDTQSANIPSFRVRRSGAAGANLATGDVTGTYDFVGKFNGAYGSIARIGGQYQGDGTTRLGDMVFSTSNGAVPAEVFRLTSSGQIKTLLAQGVLTVDANGYLVPSSVTKAQLEGFQAQIDGKQASGNYITQLTGDVTATGPGSAAATIAAKAVTNAKMADMASMTIKGNGTGASGAPQDLTAAQVTAMLNLFTATLQGLVPASGGGTTNFLRADGTWAAVASPEKAGVITLTAGTTSQAVVFNTAKPNTNYTPFFSFMDTVSGMPIYRPATVIAISTSGFTVEWNDAIIGANTKLNWGTLAHNNP